jgi:hypothetical protein
MLLISKLFPARFRRYYLDHSHGSELKHVPVGELVHRK